MRNQIETPFQYLVIQQGNYVVVQAGEDIREKFKAFHHEALKAGFKLWIIPAGIKVRGDFSYTFKPGTPLFDWVEVKGVK
jgi:hypothetical protein